MISEFFEHKHYLIDEQLHFFKFGNVYQVLDENGQEIGSVKQVLTTGQKLLRLVVDKRVLPFRFEIRDSEDRLQAGITRGWSFWLSKIKICDGNGNEVGRIKQKFRIIKPKFAISNNFDMPIAEIAGDWKAWDFTITDPAGTQLGTINKKWTGLAQEFLTDADKYLVSMNTGSFNKENKIAILAGAITIDMVLKENKS